ncbi:MAG: hypothetical protein KJZ83_11905 [Burkholderiaceae bacterium]|nr:hypothetical protein [Burkholderiaceae bacterium]
MKKLWSIANHAYAARSLRERLMIALLATVALPLLVAFVWAEPRWRSHDLLTVETAQLRAAGNAAPNADPNRIAREEVETLKVRSAQAQTELATLSQALVAPQEMPALLESLVRRSPGVTLASLRSLKSEPLAPGARGEAAATLFRHGIELELQGSWTDLRGYLAAIEKSPRRLLWGQIELQAQSYPKLVLRLRMHTLSLDSAWLQL